MEKSIILVVDDDSAVRESLKLILGERYEIVAAKDGIEASEVAASRQIDIVLMDVMMPGIDGIESMERIKRLKSGIIFIMLSGMDSAQKAVESLKKGAQDYITKPFDSEELIAKIDKYAREIKRGDEAALLNEGIISGHGYAEMISRSPKMREVFELIKKVGLTSSNVLVTGESGTGKELVARAIQSIGERRNRPFVAVNCGAVPSELMESELFGHEKGAFTGAHARKIGKFEYADGGTVFLDEVSTLPMHLQIKLLRVLQEKSFERVGGNVPIKVDIRVIAATNVDLQEAVKGGRFREDLYYRLKVVPIELPPLRERKEDIPLLARHFIEKHGKKCNKTISGITDEAIETLMSYSWPGNIRELENLFERLVVLAMENSVIGIEALPASFCSEERQKEDASFKEACRLFERHYIMSVLDKTNWNRREAARKMNIHRNTLLIKMRDLGIKAPQTRQFK